MDSSIRRIKKVPKDGGQGVMISTLQSREFGFGLLITEEQMRRVNEARVGLLTEMLVVRSNQVS
jgi:hypothetical protein